MSDLERRSGSGLTRRQREQRAYRLVLASGTLGVIFVAATILWIVGILGGTLPVLSAILAVICVILLRRTLSP